MASSPADGLPLAAQQQFEGLRQCFAVGLDARWRDISQAADLPAQQALLHRLCAGSFGFERLGQLAREAEGHCVSGDTAALAVSLRQLEFEIKAAQPLPTAS